MKSMRYVYVVAVLLIANIAASELTLAKDGVDNQKAILVTGASTGIGRKTTEILAARGYFVYAGARKQADLDELNEIENVQAVRLDVTVQEDIDAAVETVRNGELGLYGLVNNAGVYIAGPIMDVSDDELIWLFDVNVFGVYRVTQAFAPLIIESRGRITTIGSIAGILSGSFWSHYSMSKHAVEAFTDSLATEMARFDVQVSIIEPGNYNSNLAESAFKRMAELGYANEDSPYAEELDRYVSAGGDRSHFKEPDEVAEAVMLAMSSDDPKRRYMVVPNAEEAGWTINQAMREMVQLNERQPYSYSREELIEMLNVMVPSTD